MLDKAVLLFFCGAAALLSAVPLGCASGVPLGDFQLSVRRDPKLPALPLRGINRLEEGQTILYAPDKLRLNPKGGEVTLVLAPAPAKPGTLMNELPKLEVLAPQPANKPAQWTVPYRTGVVAAGVRPTRAEREEGESLPRERRRPDRATGRLRREDGADRSFGGGYQFVDAAERRRYGCGAERLCVAVWHQQPGRPDAVAQPAERC